MDETLPRQFKLEEAPVLNNNKQDIINLLCNKMYLLSATFEINGRQCQVMVDTGATISCLPEYGEVLKHTCFSPEKTNVLVKMANGCDEHISAKVRAAIKPACSAVKPRVAQFYIQSGAKDIFGYEALIGLKQLKLFDLDIITKNDKIKIYHQNKLIGQESLATAKISAGVKVIDKITPVVKDDDIRHILSRFKSVFSDINERPINGKPMRFYTVHQRPIYAKQRHYTTEEVEAMKLHVKSLLDQGIIEPTISGYAATSRIIPKKNGTGRLVVNYIPLNAVTYRDSYALPHISDILGVLQGNKYFTTMDCAQGFYQIEVDSRDRHKTAFSTPVGNYQFKRCPFGARNSCAVFQAEINRIFFDGLYKRCVIYVDDILVFGKDRKEHNENLEWVLKQCSMFNVKIKLEKCHFAQEEVQYLGFQISGSSIKPIASKVDALSKSHHPRDKTELRSLLGKLNFYSRFIPYYSTLLEPLRTLLTKNKDYQWKEHHQKAFESLITSLKQADSHALVSRKTHKTLSLHVLNDSIETILTTDDDKMVARSSRLLSAAESNYSSVEKQLLGLVFAVDKFKLLIEPDNFTVKVPDNGLQKTMNLVNRPDRVDLWLMRLPAGFDTFKFAIDESIALEKHKNNKLHIPQEIFYIDGACRSNGKPNCKASWAICAEYDKSLEESGLVLTNPSNQSAELTAAIKACKLAKKKGLNEITIVTDSKYLFSAATLWIDKWKNNDWKDHKNKPVINTDLFKQLLVEKQGLEIEWIHVKGHADNVGNIRADLLAKSLLDSKAETLNAIVSSQIKLQQNNQEIDDLKEQIEGGIVTHLQNIEDTIYYIDPKLPEGSNRRIYVPKDSRYWLLTLAHDDVMYGGHLGIKKTYRKLVRFWWPRMHNEVESYVKSCDTCQRFKNPSGLPPGYLHSIPVSKVFENLHLDIVGPMKTSYRGNCYVITATDAFSKWAFAAPSQKVRTSELIEFIESKVLAIHGKPIRIITDRGTQFTSSEWKEFMNKMGIKHNLTTPYHPQSNGIDERLNGTLMRILRAYVDEYQEHWDDHLKWSLYVYNTTVHESTGYSPYQILHGMDSRSPLKPSNNSDENSSISIPNSSQSIRDEVNERIKTSQENQRKYYDKRHTEPKLYIGQMVYSRVHAAPTYLSKKFYNKWSGPFIITGFIGDVDKPKAVCILDFKNMIKKIVAITDVKPVINRYERPEDDDQTQKDDGHALLSSRDSRSIEDSSYYVNCDIDNDEETSGNENRNEYIADNHYEQPNDQTDCLIPTTSQKEDDLELDISSRTCAGPVTSTPRRVTINNDVETHIFNPQQSTITSRPIRNRQIRKSPGFVTLSPPSSIFDLDSSQKDPTYRDKTRITKLPPKKPILFTNKPAKNPTLRTKIPTPKAGTQTGRLQGTSKRKTSSSSSFAQSSKVDQSKTDKRTKKTKQSSSKDESEDSDDSVAILIEISDPTNEDLIKF